MNFLPFFFICTRMFHFLLTQKICYVLQGIAHMLAERRRHPERKQVVLVDAGTYVVLVYILCDICYLFYCIWLMLEEATWVPGFLLLVIAATESFAAKARISGAFLVDERGIVLPRPWLRYLVFGESMFILLGLFEG